VDLRTGSEGTSEKHVNLSQGTRCSGRDSNRELLKYKSEASPLVPTVRPIVASNPSQGMGESL
jgi:hypothetical protein